MVRKCIFFRQVVIRGWCTQKNLGNAYLGLSKVRDRKENLDKAIEAYKEALKIYTRDKYPEYHKMMMTNLEQAKEILE